METEDYLGKSVNDILSILNKLKNQPTFLTYGEATIRAIKTIANFLQHVIPCTPSVILTTDPTPNDAPTPVTTTTPPKNIPEPIPAKEPIPLIVPAVSLTITPAQVQRVPLKSPGGTAIPAKNSLLPRPVLPLLEPC